MGAIQVTSSRKGAKSRTYGRKSRSTGTKARTRAGRRRESHAELARRLAEGQAATSEVLRVISSSSGDLEPVFETMLANATRLCQAKFGTLYLWDGAAFRVGALHNAPPAFAEAVASVVQPPRTSLYFKPPGPRIEAFVM